MTVLLGINYNCFYSLVYGLIYVTVLIYDVITLPIYFLLQNPIKMMNRAKMKQATIVDRGRNYITYKATKKPFPCHKEIEDNKIQTMAELFDYACKKHDLKKCLGTREILGEEDEVQSNGRVFKKYILGEYKWLTFSESNRLSTQFGKGLVELGNKPQQPIAILAETQAKWLLAAQGAFKNSFPIATIYATLGDDAIVHALNETEVNLVITSFALLPKFKKILYKAPLVKTVVYMEDQLQKLNDKDSYKDDVTIVAFDEVVEKGTGMIGKPKKVASQKPKEIIPSCFDPLCCPTSPPSVKDETRPSPEDLAIIMYTSGSTGIPKGVRLLHRNLIASVTAFMDCTKMYFPEIVMGYLPLAHVLELLVENGILFMGSRIGYSSALTMIDTASKIKKGTKGDASVLRPTFMCSVPLILDRISKAVRDKVEKSSPLKQVLFKFGYVYKNKWRKMGFKTPLTDAIIFKATRSIMGGNLHLMAVGGAPLTADTHELINTCLGVSALQGYGLTETCACASNQDQYALEYETVGPPMTTALIRVTNWEEGNYYVTDKPNPRGEIVVGGGIVSPGYYKNDEKTKEEFFQDKGVWWFKTGDIGEIFKDGSIKIIDRKKDLVKLQAGEYVSLGKVEALLTTCSLVETICAYAESTKSSCVALIVSNQDNLKKLAAERLKITDKSFEELCDDPAVNKMAQQELANHAKKVKLEKFEVPERVKLVKEVWLPETGLVTATFKLKRKEIQKFYEKDLEKLYS